MRLIDADRLKRQVAGRSYRAKEKFLEMIENSPTVAGGIMQAASGYVTMITINDHDVYHVNLGSRYSFYDPWSGEIFRSSAEIHDLINFKCGSFYEIAKRHEKS